jgi:virginiamycin B lyase
MRASASTVALVLTMFAPAEVAEAQAVQGAPARRDTIQPVQISEWTVPWEKSRPRDPYVAPDGRVWFVGQAGNYVAVLEPHSGEFKRFEIDPGTHPHNLIVDRKGVVWYSGNRNGMIGKLDPATGSITRYPMPAPDLRDPHTMVFDRTEENIWFTAQQSNYVGRLNTRTGKIDVVKLATPNARPYGIAVDTKGRVWFNQFGVPKIATIDPKTLLVKEYALPNNRTRDRRIGLTSDGRVWYVDYTRGYLGRLDPATSKVDEWANPSGAQSMPYAMTVDDRDRIWYVETGVQPNRLVGFDPKLGKVFSITPIAQSGGLTVRHMIYHAPTKSIWFGTDANTIGQARVEPAGERAKTISE